VYGDQERYEATYFTPYKGYYFSGDGAMLSRVLDVPLSLALAAMLEWVAHLLFARLTLWPRFGVVRGRPAARAPHCSQARAGKRSARSRLLVLEMRNLCQLPRDPARRHAGARRDADGYFWITGRVDDVINVSGHRIGTAEVESALVLNDKCAEAAVVAYEHAIKGQGIYAYVTLMDGVEPSDALRKELIGCGPGILHQFAGYWGGFRTSDRRRSHVCAPLSRG
jgi:AMP-binding enzyme C-terminal domain